MKIAIISDIHDNMHNLRLAYTKALELRAKQMLCLGDFINPGIARFLSKSEIPVFSVWGNNDGEKCAIIKLSLEEGSNLTLSNKIYDFFEIDGRKLFLTHYWDIAEPMAYSGKFDAIFFGHTHEKEKRKIKDCLILNPGELSTHKFGVASIAIYDTKTNDAEIIDLENALINKWNK